MISDIIKKIQSFADGVDHLSQREKWILFGGGMLVVSFLLFFLLISPFLESKKMAKETIVRKQAELVTIKALQAEYRELKNTEGSVQQFISKRDKGFTLFTFLDRQAGKAEIKEKIKYMKPSLVEGDSFFDESLVELKLEEVTLAVFVAFLRSIESKENVVYVKRMSISEAENRGYLDIVLQIATFVEKEDD